MRRHSGASPQAGLIALSAPSADRSRSRPALLLVAIMAWAAPLAALAKAAERAGRAPALTIERHLEDWSYLSDPARRTGHWTEPFKYIPLSEDGLFYLTTGLEARTRHESYHNPNWGLEPDNDYVWHRLMPYADLHVGRVRVFAQSIVTEITVDDRAVSPVDSTGADMVQAFVEVDLDISDQASLRVSAGRKLLSLGAGRLVDTRYGPNVPQAFDGIEATLASGTRQVTALGVRPADNRLGDFDDRPSEQKALWGVYATQWMTEDRRSGFDLYYLGFRDRAALYNQGFGRHDVHSFGARIFGQDGAWRWNLETILQRGEFAGARSQAWGIGGEIAHRFDDVPMTPELNLTVDYIPGDDDPDDPELGTFNPLFARGRYFAAQSPVGPRNLIHVQPSITLHPADQVDVSLTGTGYWRESTRDGIYSIPGFLVRSGRSSEARFIGYQLELAVTWRATPELELSGSMSAFRAGTFIRETGPSETILLAGAAASFRF